MGKVAIKKMAVWATILWLIALCVFSIYGSVLKIEDAKAFFNSPLMIGYWITLTVLLIIGFIFFFRLRRDIGLLAMHGGCIILFGGAMWGSELNQKLLAKHTESEKIRNGFMQIFEKDKSNNVFSEEGELLGKIPFDIKLEDFRMEYYWDDGKVMAMTHDKQQVSFEAAEGTTYTLSGDFPVIKVLRVFKNLQTETESSFGQLIVQSQDGLDSKFDSTPGGPHVLGENYPTITILQRFKNFKMEAHGGSHIFTDKPGGRNPALEVQLNYPDGRTKKQWIFGDYPDQNFNDDGMRLLYMVPPAQASRVFDAYVKGENENLNPVVEVELQYADGRTRKEWVPLDNPAKHYNQDGIYLSYMLMPKDYFSDLEVYEGDDLKTSKTIEVNKPLHYGGYYFYQSSYDPEAGRYTVLSVTSDTGFGFVFGGFFFIAAGAFWHFWVSPILKHSRKGSINGN